VAWEDGLEGSNTVRVCSLDTAKKGCVPSYFISSSHNSRVITSGVTVPDININLWNWFAGCDVDVLNLKVEGDTRLTLSNVLADKLASDVVWTIGIFWAENA